MKTVVICFFLTDILKSYQNRINHRKKTEFKALKMKPMRVIQATPKVKTKILSQKRKTSNDSKGKSFQKAKKKRLETSSDSEDYEEKELVDDKSDGETQM